jgi:ubiquinone/menaquinone biosynthesis C-methylase UbiE
MLGISHYWKWLHGLFSRPEERNKYSGGYFPYRVRKQALSLCRGLGGRILEVGCGEGLFLAQLLKQNPDLQIWGIDNNAERLKEAEMFLQKNNLGKVHLSLQEATSLNFENEYFDAVVCINVVLNFESLDTVKKALREMARVCKRKGKVIFDFRNSANLLMRWKYKFAPLYDPTVKKIPLNTHSLEKINLLLKEEGLNIIHKKYLGFPIKIMTPIIILETEKV